MRRNSAAVSVSVIFLALRASLRFLFNNFTTLKASQAHIFSKPFALLNCLHGIIGIALPQEIALLSDTKWRLEKEIIYD